MEKVKVPAEIIKSIMILGAFKDFTDNDHSLEEKIKSIISPELIEFFIGLSDMDLTNEFYDTLFIEIAQEHADKVTKYINDTRLESNQETQQTQTNEEVNS